MTDKKKLPTEKQIAIYDMLDAKCTVTDEGVQGFLTWKQIRDVYNSFQEEPISEELEDAAKNYAANITDKIGYKLQLRRAVVYGAKLKELQFERERLKHCEALTNEQAQIESDFVSQHLKKNNRTPTFIDAIEYGMKKQKEQLMAEAIDVEVKVDAGNYPYIPQLELYDYDKDVPLAKEGDKYKVILIKED